MMRLLQRAHTGRSAAASTMHSDAASAAPLSLRSILLPAPLAVHPLRSLHCSSQSRGTSKGKQARPRNSQQRGSQSKDDQSRKAQRSNGNNGTNDGRHTSAESTAALTASNAESKPSRFAAPASSSVGRPVDSTKKGRPSDESTTEQRDRDDRSPPDHAARVTSIQPFRFDVESGQSEKLQRAFHQLRLLAHRYMAKFPSKSAAIALGMTDITQKTDWQSMRSQARELLSSLLQLSSSADSAEGRLTTFQCQLLLHACNNFRLVQSPLPVLTAMMAIPERVPAKCISMLLVCIVKSPEWAAQTGETAPCGDHPAVSALCAGRPAPSAEFRGVELAEWMLEGMASATLRDRFEMNVVVWNNLLQGMIHAASMNCDDSRRLQRARAFYERIPNKAPDTHSTMLTAYQRAGMHAEHEALWQLVSADPFAGASPHLTSARLAMIHEKLDTPQRRADLAAHRLTKLTAEESALVQEAFELWTAAKEKPAERMNAVVTGATLKLLALLGHIPLLLALIREAIDAAQGQPLVFAHPACSGLLFDSMSESPDPALWKAQAQAAWDQLLLRYADAQTRNLPDRANKLLLDEATWSAYMRYLQLTHQRDEFVRVWLTAPRHLQDGNPHIFLARLKVLVRDGDVAAAERIFDEMLSFNVQPQVTHFAAWIGCYKQSKLEGRCAEAEQVWQRMLDSNVTPAPYCYRDLMLVYMRDGSPAQVEKIDRLYAEMLRAIPAGMSVGDYQRLIKTAHRCRLASEARKWSERVKAAGLWKDLDDASRDIVDRIDEWKDLPRDSESD